MEIYRATIKDLSELKQLEAVCFDDVHENFEYVLTSENHLYFYILDAKNHICAYIGASISLDESELLYVCVSEAYRKKGYAKELFLKLINELKLRNVNKLFLEVNENNTAAINLYKKIGFTLINKRRNYYGNETALVMLKNLWAFIACIFNLWIMN